LPAARLAFCVQTTTVRPSPDVELKSIGRSRPTAAIDSLSVFPSASQIPYWIFPAFVPSVL
jgi:hypothetical protein